MPCFVLSQGLERLLICTRRILRDIERPTDASGRIFSEARRPRARRCQYHLWQCLAPTVNAMKDDLYPEPRPDAAAEAVSVAF